MSLQMKELILLLILLTTIINTKGQVGAGHGKIETGLLSRARKDVQRRQFNWDKDMEGHSTPSMQRRDDLHDDAQEGNQIG